MARLGGVQSRPLFFKNATDIVRLGKGGRAERPGKGGRKIKFLVKIEKLYPDKSLKNLKKLKIFGVFSSFFRDFCGKK